MAHWHVVTGIHVRGHTTFEPWGYFENEGAAREAAERDARETLKAWQNTQPEYEEHVEAMLAPQVFDTPWEGDPGIPPDSVVSVALALELVTAPTPSPRLRWEGNMLVIENPPSGFLWGYRVEQCPHSRSECLAAQEALGFPDWDV